MTKTNIYSHLPLLAGVAIAGSLLAAGTARATPYAYASNQITGLTITASSGTRITPTAFSETVTDQASFSGYSGATSTNGATSTATPVSIPQAFSGPTAPASSGYSALGVGSFTGTRANASIGSGDALSGGVAVNNVAEGSGNTTSFGASLANNKATFGFLFTTPTNETVTLSFSDLYKLAVSTTLPGETSNAALQDTFSVSDAAGTVATYAPGVLNATLGASNGSSNSAGGTTFTGTFTTPTLTAGTLYTLSLTSGSSENIFPPTAVPEPASLALLGSALFGVGLLRRRRS